MKALFIFIALLIIGLGIYNSQIKNKSLVDINSSQASKELGVNHDNIKSPTELMRSGIEIPLETMCEKAGGTLVAQKCYEGEAKEINETKR